MAIHHARPGEIVDIRHVDPPRASAGTTTVLKTHDVEVLRMVLPAGKDVPMHDVPRETIVQGLEGRVEIRTDARRCTLEPGHLLYLEGGQSHSLHAIEDSMVLVTILLAHKGE